LVSLLNLDEEARASRLEFLEIDDADRQLLGELGEALLPHVEEVIDRWYEFLVARPETRDLLERGRVKAHLKDVQTRYFRQLLSGPYDRSYFEDRLKIGFIHERVGLAPPWYTGAYRKFQDLSRDSLVERGHPTAKVVAWLRALEKIIYLDMELALDAYFDTAHRGLLEANESLRQMTAALEVRNRELSREFERAQEAARIKEELLSRVSHELRTPLNSVLGFADLLLDGIEGPVSEEQAGSLRKIRDHGNRLLVMIDRMIEAAKMAASGVFAPRPFDLRPVVARLVEAGRIAAEAKGLEFQAEVDPDLPPVLGDEAGFELALGHLIENAAKFTAQGSVRFEARRVGTVVRFTVVDTGPGIPAEHRAQIFEPFHQVEFGDTRTATGLGIGLTLARQALERMGGSLELTSCGPGGSTFTVELPLQPAPEP
jgi:signal transduction histidine kinase